MQREWRKSGRGEGQPVGAADGTCGIPMDTRKPALLACPAIAGFFTGAMGRLHSALLPSGGGGQCAEAVLHFRFPRRWVIRNCFWPRGLHQPAPARRSPGQGAKSTPAYLRQPGVSSETSDWGRPGWRGHRADMHGAWTHDSSQSLKGRPGKYQGPVRSETVHLCSDR